MSSPRAPRRRPESTKSDGDRDDDLPEVDLGWLERNGRPLKIGRERDRETDAWTRGKGNVGGLDVEEHEAPGHKTVALPDGDEHEIVLVSATGDGGPDGFVGACDCRGFRMHQKTCAHLIAEAVRDSLEGTVPVDPSRAAAIQGGDGGDTVADGDGETDRDDDERRADGAHGTAEPGPLSDVGGLNDVDDVDQEPSADTTTVATVDESRRAPAGPSDPFAKELGPDIPNRYTMQLGGETYLRRAGLAAIAYDAGLRPTVEPVVPADDTGFQHARYRAKILDERGDVVAIDVGTAVLEEEDMTGAAGNLDELASTRALRRALELATGAGASLKEGPR